MERKCKFCGREYIWKRSSGHTRERCNSCGVNQRRFALKVKIVEYLGGKCSRCGYERCVAALHAHHRMSSDKMFNLSGAHCRSWKVIKAELDKCDLVCANCHAEIHYGTVYPV